MRRYVFAFALLCSLVPFAPSFAASLTQLTDLSGKPAALPDKGKLLVVFWATWCTDCRHKLKSELPELDSRKDVGVITINTDKEEGRAQRFVSKENITVPVYRDANKQLQHELGVHSVPHWAVYEKAGNDWKLAQSEGAFEWDHVKKALGMP